jgi:hypothetical protein
MIACILLLMCNAIGSKWFGIKFEWLTVYEASTYKGVFGIKKVKVKHRHDLMI